jgi:hypothetical protein
MTETTTQLATHDTGAMLERLVVDGDCSKLTAGQKVQYYVTTCESLGLNYRTQPFAFIRFQGKEILYAKRDCTDQLRKANSVSIVSLERERIDDLYMVTATAKLPDGRTDSAIGAVPIGGLKGEALANAFMKAETKAKRRATLSICGLGMTDESEVSGIPGAETIELEALPASAPEAQETHPAESVKHADARMPGAVEAYSKLLSNCEKLGLNIPRLRSGMTADDILAQYEEYKGLYLEAKEARAASRREQAEQKTEAQPVAVAAGDSDLPF